MKPLILFGVMLLAMLAACGRQEPPAPVAAPKPAPQKAPSMPTLKSESAPPLATPAPDTAPPTAGPPGTKSGPAAPTTSMTSAEVAAHRAETSTPEVVDVNLSMLQEVVDSYIRDTKRKPKDFQQLVAEHYLTGFPQAPKGKRYVIDQPTMTVKSVNQ